MISGDLRQAIAGNGDGPVIPILRQRAQ